MFQNEKGGGINKFPKWMTWHDFSSVEINVPQQRHSKTPETAISKKTNLMKTFFSSFLRQSTIFWTMFWNKLLLQIKPVDQKVLTYSLDACPVFLSPSCVFVAPKIKWDLQGKYVVCSSLLKETCHQHSLCSLGNYWNTWVQMSQSNWRTFLKPKKSIEAIAFGDVFIFIPTWDMSICFCV